MFNQFGLNAKVLKAIDKLGFSVPTPVQAQTIPNVMAGRDVVSLAETGSGKTAAYLAPTLSQILDNPEGQVLILAPTRELAGQIGTVIRDLSAFAGRVNYAILIGGSSMGLQIRSLRAKPHFIIATPGRLMDHARKKTVDLKRTTHLILDEADRMFDMGFAPQVNEIIRLLPGERQTMLFSATFPKDVRTLADRVLRDPVEVEIGQGQKAPVVIDQKVFAVDQAKKNDKTLDIVNSAVGSVIVFTRTKSRTDRLTKYLEEYGVKVGRIHGDRSQAQREKVIKDFKSGVLRVMVATDIAARGLDIPNISNVLNYDVPMTAEDYIHRIGRTGRAGQAGESLTFVASDEEGNWNYIARKLNLPPVGNKPGVAGGPPRKQGKPHGGKRKRPRSFRGFQKPHRRGGHSSGADKPNHHRP